MQSEAKVVKILFKIQKERGGQVMELLKERIRKDGVVKEGNVLKVDRFLNHQMDVKLFREIGKEFKKRFEGEDINKILTIEASGIGIACVVAEIFDVPVVFAKKTQTKNIAGDVYTTKGRIIHTWKSLRHHCIQRILRRRRPCITDRRFPCQR